MRKMGPKPFVSDEYEQVLIKWILSMQRRRFPVTTGELVDSVQRFVVERKIQNTFTGSRPG